MRFLPETPNHRSGSVLQSRDITIVSSLFLQSGQPTGRATWRQPVGANQRRSDLDQEDGTAFIADIAWSKIEFSGRNTKSAVVMVTGD